MTPGADTSYLLDLQRRLARVRLPQPPASPGTREKADPGGQSSPSLFRTTLDRVAEAAPRAETDELTEADTTSAAAAQILEEVAEAEPAPSSLAREVEVALGQDWESLSPQARGSLIQGERIRRDLDETAGEPFDDYAPAVFAYGRALEIELYRRLFEPLREAPRISDEPTGDGKVDFSLELLQRFQAGDKPPAMGQMARCLANLGCDAAPRNGFGRFLEERLLDAEAFCSSRYPKWLSKFTLGYRNPACHLDPISRDRCAKARAYLLEEPRRLLLALIEFAPEPA